MKDRLKLTFKILIFLFTTVMIIISLIIDFEFKDINKYTSKILYYHVISAWISFLSFVLSAYYSIKFILINRLENKLDTDIIDKRAKNKNDIILKTNISINLGLLFILITLITGSIWSYYSWGLFWNWDPRQSSIIFLILYYLAFIALRTSIKEETLKNNIISIYSIIGFFMSFTLIFIIPRVFPSLHPNLIKINTINMNDNMLLIFLGLLIGFSGIYYWIFDLSYRIAKLK